MKILLVDDHAVVRQGLRRILAEQLPGPTFGEAQDGAEALELVRSDRWDIVILDISMPRKGGMEALRDMRREQPKLPVLVLSLHSEEEYARRAFRTGAAGYITKESAPEELMRAVRKVLAGGTYVSAAMAERLATGLADDEPRAPHELLSDREHQVFRMLASGKAIKEIAGELALSEKTVSTYRARVLEKLQVRSNAELVRYAVRTGYVE